MLNLIKTNYKTNTMNSKIHVKSLLSVALLACVLISCEKPEKKPEKEVLSMAYKDHLIDRKLGKILSAEYENGNYKLINSTRKEPDSKEVYYDLEVLEGYIAFVKVEAAKKGIKNPGIKVVMGQYPKDRVIDPRQEEIYKGYQTSYFKPVENLNVAKAQSGGDDGDGMGDVPGLNMGTLCPPR